jgi:ribonuclease R
MMNEQDTRIYALLAQPHKIEDLRRALPEMSRQELLDSMERLCASGKVLKNKKNYYAQAQHYGCIVGTFLATARSFSFVAPDEKTDDGDIFIAPNASGGAWQGDRVLVHLLPPSRNEKHRQEGEVIRILEPSRQEITGALCQKKNGGYYVQPTSSHYPEIVIPGHKLAGAVPGDCVAVRVTFRGDDRLPPQGVIAASMGENGTMEASIASILRENAIFEPFPPEVMRQAGSIPQEIDRTELTHRLDLRDKLIFTIDGDDAKDFDDAVSLEVLPGGHLLLGVHIADVSHYVTPGSPLDMEALRRGTSVYYPGHVIPMLPFALSNGICSLNPNVERLAFSALLELDADGRRYGAQFAKSVICSKARMTYRKVNAILDGDPELQKEYDFLVPTVRQMAALAKKLYEKRIRRGALELDIPEAAITVDADGKPVEVSFRERGASEKLIEEFMLQANEAVAEYMSRRELPTVYRVHENPDPDKLRVFAQFARPFGYRIDPGKPEDTHQFQVVLEGAKNDPKQRILPTLLLRSLARARYADECIGHYGLAAKYYLHFTSPIRRYPDLIAHRMLQKALTREDFTQTDSQLCEEAAAQSTAREQAADNAERDIDKLFLAAFMQPYIGEEFDGEVSGVQAFGVFVSLPSSVEGLIRIENLSGDYYEYDDTHMTLIGKHSGFRYAVGTPVRVRLVAASCVTGQIDFVPAGAPDPVPREERKSARRSYALGNQHTGRTTRYKLDHPIRARRERKGR